MANIKHYIMSAMRKNTSVIDNKDLAEYRSMNTISRSGFSTNVPYEKFLAGSSSGNSWTLQTVNCLKNWNFAKWDYSGMPKEIPLELLEGMLFLWGRVAWGKKNGEYFLYTFNVRQKNHYGFVEKVDLRSIGSGKVIHKNVEVGKDCFIIYNDTSYWLPNMKVMYGPLWRVWGLLESQRMVWNTIIQKSKIGRNIFLVSQGIKGAELTKLNAMLDSKARFFPVLDGGMVSSGISQNAGLGSAIVEANIDSATEELWNTYHNIDEEIKAKLGIVGNINPKKKERQVGKEIEVSNTLPNYNLECELKNRKIGFDKINEIFGLNIQVELKQIEQEDEEVEEPEKDGKDGEN